VDRSPSSFAITLFVALRALFLGGLFLGFWFFAALLTHRLDRLWNLALPQWTALPGTILLALGAAVSLPCVVVFIGRGRGTPAPFDPPQKFVATGLYRYCRNPMYVGLLLMLGGLALIWQSPAVIILAALLAVAIHSAVVALEEPQLKRRFGQPYLDYCGRVPRWLPRI
jgi:protein-S-isoprenylcysteine O-methyltransferase Ste14